MDVFTKKYQILKTLKFELVPVGETRKFIKDIVKQDKQRSLNYKIIKEIINDYHRDFINSVLSLEVLSNEDIEKTFNEYIKGGGRKKVLNNKLKEMQCKLRKKIADKFSKQAKLPEYALFDARLINEKGSGEKLTKGCLWYWLKDRLDNNTITQEEFDKSEKVIKNFNKFYTYFTGFNQNRQNIYSAEEHSTAISYRIVHENMIKHFNNCLNFANIEKNHKDLYRNLEIYKDVFTPSAFTLFLSQNGINIYNEKIGHKSDDVSIKGINQLINEYCQNNSTKDSKIKLPKMAIFYKQILSDTENNFKIDVLENDKQLLSVVNDFYKSICIDLIGLEKCFNEHFNNSNFENIYIKNDVSLTNISKQIWNDWSLIRSALETYANEVLKLNKTQKKKWLKEEVLSISQIQKAVDNYIKDFEDKSFHNKTIISYLRNFRSRDGSLLLLVKDTYQQVEQILSGGSLKKDRKNKIKKIKALLDAIMNVLHFVKPLSLIKSGKAIEVSPKNTAFYDSFDALYKNLSEVIDVYNKTRNYVTQKPYKTDKFKINFENSTLLDGWDVNKETDNTSILLFRGGRYYLGIMRKDANHIFDYIVSPYDSIKEQIKKEQLRHQIIAKKEEDNYEKMVFKLIPCPSKMLPKVFFSKKSLKIYQPSNEIKKIKEEKLYRKDANDRKSLIKWIDFMKQSLARHPEWGKYFDFSFQPSSDYQDVSQFYKQVEEQGYSISFDKVKKDYIDEKNKAGELYLFEIYNKDFSKFSKGKPNLHTSYWRMLFAKENLNDLSIKLKGKGEVFFRPASLRKNGTVIHEANTPIANKNPFVRKNKENSIFDYDIVKDNRFTSDKFFFYCPVSLNPQEPKEVSGDFNKEVNNYLNQDADINIIGIDRGERHLLYYSVINKNGTIIEEGSLNTITNSYEKDGEFADVETNYHQLLSNKESQREESRKSWSTIENIKDLKSGYLSHVVFKLSQLMIKHNAIIVLENLNTGFKQNRFKVEKQVYQKFEKALINKLNYLVFKDREFEQAGHYLNAYQLTAPLKSFSDMREQSGFLFYVNPSYTSKIDPVTGFVNTLNTRYRSVKKSQSFFNNFDKIYFNKKNNYFEFTFDYKNFSKNESKKTNWTVCTIGDERYHYDIHKKKTLCCDVTGDLKKLFEEYNINYKLGEDLIGSIVSIDSASFFKRLLSSLRLVLQLRYSYKDGNIEKDFILSPVADMNDEFFDSRKHEGIERPLLPSNADANGAYNIARKGIMVLEQIRTTGKPSFIRNVEWFDFAQKEEVIDSDCEGNIIVVDGIKKTLNAI